MGVYDYQKELLRKNDTYESTDSEYYSSQSLLGNNFRVVRSSGTTYTSLLTGVGLAFSCNDN